MTRREARDFAITAVLVVLAANLILTLPDEVDVREISVLPLHADPLDSPAEGGG